LCGACFSFNGAEWSLCGIKVTQHNCFLLSSYGFTCDLLLLPLLLLSLLLWLLL